MYWRCSVTALGGKYLVLTLPSLATEHKAFCKAGQCTLQLKTLWHREILVKFSSPVEQCKEVPKSQRHMAAAGSSPLLLLFFFSCWAGQPACIFKSVPFTAENSEAIWDAAGSDVRSKQSCACDQVSMSKYFVCIALDLFTEETPHWLHSSTLLFFKHLTEMTVNLWG